jgi:dephospho-CoA kinase
MKWIGLTGGIACGKSSVAELLRARGVSVADADVFSHAAFAENTASFLQIKSQFGMKVLASDGSIDRRALGEIVFADRQQLLQLEAIVHPVVKAMTLAFRKKCQDEKRKIAVYDVPLLFEKSMQSQFDIIIVVTCNFHLQKSRLMQRNGWSEAQAEVRIASQLPITEKVSKADFVIDNSGDRKALALQVDRCLAEILNGI